MMLATAPLFRPTPPPLWFVTNGEAVVGPVTTNLLLRGVAERRVPDDCLVRERAWSGFRPLDNIREIAALRRRQAQEGIVRVEKATWKPVTKRRSELLERLERELTQAGDIGEVLLVGLMEAMSATGARVGAVHRLRAPYVGLVTSCVSGPCMHSRLGHVLPERDPVLAGARLGRALAEKPRSGYASAAVRGRLGMHFAAGGVATWPLYCMNRVYALVELGRPDHEFRRSDLSALADIGNALTHRITVVRNAGS